MSGIQIMMIAKYLMPCTLQITNHRFGGHFSKIYDSKLSDAKIKSVDNMSEMFGVLKIFNKTSSG